VGAGDAGAAVAASVGQDALTVPTQRRTLPERRLEGLVAVITGASSGVGRAIARQYAREGARVALIARGLDGLWAAAREVEALGSRALVLALDVSDAAAVNEAAAEVVKAWGRIDVWVNDAMVSVFAPAEQITPAEYRRVTEVNYLGYVHGTLAALAQMKKRDRGVIVQIGSALAYRSIPLQAAYCASKAAIRGFTDSLRSELYREKSKVKLTMLQLPAVNTPQFEVVRNRLPGHPQPVPPIYQPEVVAEAAVLAALNPRREAWLGWSTTFAIIGQKLIPGALDRYLAHRAWESQTTRRLPARHARHVLDNVDETIPGDRGARGPFSDRSRGQSTKLLLRENPSTLAVLGVGVLLAVGAPLWRLLR
jgi:NADP-dependent 3-hydroxy acid dehydrogenase YdfG